MAEEVRLIRSLQHARAEMRRQVTQDFCAIFARLQERVAECDLPVKRLPRHGEMRPEELMRVLPYMAIMDCSNLDAPFYRLAGTVYIEYFGCNPTGHNYLEYVPAARHHIVKAAFATCLDHQCGMLMNIHSVAGNGHERITETIALPVGDDANDRPRYLYMTTVALEEAGWVTDESLFTKRVEVLKRYFLDLGFGLPTHYLGTAIEELAA